ncbi:hypothetical protein FHG66_01490 [Rubellimicrobium rubrum]|uniref:Ubiquitin-activating enzyme E1 FCCH domain-containing protein n=1 Tax=Rubellimicrobium rubrum TaxID=2585369 RepID=A0A5C4N2R6_9RHOB|nr:hypothetical protein [Rubellimicrobium rubrum]TNC52987.1 hypothetical protein FHG66_01490 [Rubellimicrobium rubrum]
MTLANLPGPNFTGADLSARLNAVMTELRSARSFPIVAALLADTSMSYSGGARRVKAGDGVRTIQQNFGYQVAAPSATNHHLTTAGGVKLYALPSATGAFTVRQFGGAEGSDITQALQLAINAAAYGLAPGTQATTGEVLIDLRAGLVSGTIQVGYGISGGSAEFRRVAVRGLGRSYSNDPHHMGTRITSTVTDGPTFAISAGRFSSISDLSIVGVAFAAFQGIGAAGLAPTQAATWDAALTASGVTPGRRFAPHAAIAIDPYCGTAPAGAYPVVTLPSFITNTSQYGRQGSSMTRIERVGIYGFEVGVVQTPADHDNNGDFLTLRDCDMQYLKWAVSVGNNQARAVSGQNCTFLFCFAHLTNNQHGRQRGTVSGVWAGCGFAGFLGKLIELGDLFFGGGLRYEDCDVESLHRIGDIVGSSSNEKEVMFTNCTVNFRHNDMNVVPANVLAGPTKGQVRFIGGDIAGFPSMLSFRVDQIVLEGTTLISAEAHAKDYEKIAHNATMGGLVVPLLNHQTQTVRFEPYNLATGNPLLTRVAVNSGYRFTGRDFLCPLYAGPVLRQDDYLTRSMVGHRPYFYRSDAIGAQITGATRNQRTITFTSTRLGNINDRQQWGYMPGDIIRDAATGTVMVIRSTDTATGVIDAELQTNYVLNGGGYDLLDSAFSLTSGTWEFVCSRVYASPRPILGSTSTAAATISGILGSGATTANYGLAVGDFLFEDAERVQTFSTTGRLEIMAIATASGTITMNGVANRTLTDWMFDWWIKAPPANSATR